ncbi:Oidioi.mRNA.OKI2018_I69.chr1.g1363.t1.cds [Oikopleura dioica]|uniref:Oidioi.mRNA.OKI2018_I69.chr1.g1363.t1.cds n=1 Tax=Oikopleura dioica TaxID=34765 RepID=A0ABN7SUP4_OIKDI|nr:Oidioi.mRNA.OKI2018_I69.chr1.g1363.t1.cds [Oikopleura dioica]
MGDWKTGLFGCITKPGICCLSCFVRPLVAGKNAESIGENGVLWAIASFIPCGAALLRGQIRKKNGVSGAMWSDCLLHWCCPCCASGQEAMQTGALDYLLEDEMLDKATKKYNQEITRT